MPGNIKYSKGKVSSAVAELNQKIQQLLIEKADEYDRINELIVDSQGDTVNAIKEHLCVEKSTILSLATFYQQLVLLIQNASFDVEKVENNYSKDHVNGGGMHE